MTTALTSVVLVILALLALAIWERVGQRRAPGLGDPAESGASAVSFQSDTTFAEAIRILAAGDEPAGPAGDFGRWFERDSAWYPQLLTCPSHLGARMNLYYFDQENILEIHFSSAEPDAAARRQQLESFVFRELLPALGARDIKATDTVD